VTLLEVTSLHRRFGQVHAVNDVSFSLDAGEALGIVGESGSGKTTTARIVAGLERADSGAVLINGADRLTARGGGAARLARARQLQMVFQDPFLSLDPRFTASATVSEALRLHFPSIDHGLRTAELLRQVGLGEREAAARPRQLSGGQRQRVAIARALAVEPALLVLDEAVAALDVSVQAQILNLIADLRESLHLSILFISHDLAVVRQVADRVYVLYQGRLVEHGDATAVLRNPSHEYTRLLMSSLPGVPQKGTS
jgi:oligopeptide transport system ATP-binding protein